MDGRKKELTPLAQAAGAPIASAPQSLAGTLVSPALPPAGYNAAQLAAKALLNWVLYGSVNGPQMQPPVPPTEQEAMAALDLAGRLAGGQVVIVVAGSQQAAP
ncbi:MAG: hypothetical protein EBR82_25335 [Caulobacteraceae bacterium]|nr:hypothetical protein [Caulobacteraceae bacterium]